MPSVNKSLFPPRASSVAELDAVWIETYWRVVEGCLGKVFGKSDIEAQKAVTRMRSRMTGLSESAALLIYHDSPLQIASMLAGASNRELTEQELLAYDTFWRYDEKDDRPTREQILQVRRTSSKAD
jgi:hypothetical protein